jgi:hypothetical protein
MKQDEYKKAVNLTEQLLSVSHEEIKRKLDAEKAAKKRKKSSASREANDRP